MGALRRLHPLGGGDGQRARNSPLRRYLRVVRLLCGRPVGGRRGFRRARRRGRRRCPQRLLHGAASRPPRRAQPRGGILRVQPCGARRVSARRVLGLRRVLVVDWDFHHGNGTQHAFERDPSVLFFSVHQARHYPGTGLFTDVGLGSGEGFSVNLPLIKGCGDGEYAVIFERLLNPLAREFAPELILVSAGFDAHVADPGGWDAADRRRLCGPDPRGDGHRRRPVRRPAGADPRRRLPSARTAGVGQGGIAGARAKEPCDPTALRASADPGKLGPVLKRSMQVHGRYWKCFAPARSRRVPAPL